MRTFAMGERTKLDHSAIGVEFDVSGDGLAAYCFSLGSTEADVVCTARPASLTSAVALVAGGTGTAEFHVDLAAVDDSVQRLVFVVAGRDPGFGAGSFVRLVGADGEIGRFVLPVADLVRERALILAEVYRRDGWRFGAVGQGYAQGLEQLVRDLGADPEETLIGAAVMVVDEPFGQGQSADAVAAPAPAGEAEPVPEPARAAAPAPEASPEPEPSPEIGPEPSFEPESIPAAEPVPAPEAVPPSAVAVAGEVEAVRAALAAPADYTGRGDRVLTIASPVESGPFLAEIEGRGTENFVVWTLNADLETDKLLANAIGPYRGRALVDERGGRTTRLKIEADGGWTIRLLPPDAARLLTDRLTGTGPETVRWNGPRTVLATTHRGLSNFIVGAFAVEAGEDAYLGTLANAIGDYDGESILPPGPCLIELEADGPWTLTPETG
jgi:stress response protein SCP2